MKFDRNSDVTKNVKIIEWMKKELILSVGDVFDLIFKGVKPLDEALQDTLANIIMITYLLAKRLGISFSEIDYKIKEKIRIGKLVWRFFKFKKTYGKQGVILN